MRSVFLSTLRVGMLTAAVSAQVVSSAEQTPAGVKPAAPAAAAPIAAPSPASATASVPLDYVIGPEDILAVLFWRDKDLSAEVMVRPDGRISLPLLNDIDVAGLTPDQLREKVVAGAREFIEDPSVTVVVKQINSRKVFITGEVMKPGPYPLTGPTTVLQLIAVAGGLREYAEREKIVIMRKEGNRPVSYRFNYKDVMNRKNLRQNIELKPGDTVLVP